MYAPLTGIFLIAEITGGYELIIPLMIVSSSSYLIAKFFEPYSMDLKSLIKEKKVFSENYDDNILSLIKIYEITNRNFEVMEGDCSLADILHQFRKSDTDIIAIYDQEHIYRGFITFNKVRKILLNPELQKNITAQELIMFNQVRLNMKSSVIEITDIFDKSNIQLVPIFDGDHLEGFVSKPMLLAAYRNKLKLTIS